MQKIPEIINGTLTPESSPKAYRRAKAIAVERFHQQRLNRNWGKIDDAPRVDEPRLKRPREPKTKPSVNHQARYKKLARAKREL